MSQLVVAANRPPATLNYGPDGSIVTRHGAGGLAPSLSRALSGRQGLWIAAASTPAEQETARRQATTTLSSGIDLRLIDLPPEVRAAAYRVIANGTLWFVFHGMFDRVRRPLFDRHWHEAWEGYRAYNRSFAEEIAERASPGATVVVNDYHLMLVGSHLARERPDLRTVHFTHTPFCTPEELALLPSAVARELLEGLASYGACGFHTRRWASVFRRCAVAGGTGPAEVFAAPLGADVPDLLAVASSAASAERRDQRVEWLAGRRLIFRSDRIELSKNLVRGFLAYEELLLTRPAWRDRVVFVARCYPSREELPEYLAYRNEVERTVARVNERFGDLENPPIVLEIEDDFEATVAAASCYDVLLVNPIRDGMNLVAKEGPILNRRDGVLALSREAGAFAELGRHAVAVEPFDVSGTATALERALDLSAEDRRSAARQLRRLASRRPPAEWLESVMAKARIPASA